MSDIVFFCACGQKFRAPSSFAGKKLRCSECGAKVPIPFLEPPPAAPAANPAYLEAPPMAAMVDEPFNLEDPFDLGPPPEKGNKR